MNSSLTAFRNHAHASQAQLMLVQSSIPRTIPRIDTRSLLAASGASVFLFCTAILVENLADEHSPKNPLSANAGTSAVDMAKP